MNKDKIRKTIDRLPAILKAIKDSRENTNSNRSDRSAKAPPFVDEETLAIIGILDDIIEHEPTDWIRKLLESFKRKKNGYQPYGRSACFPGEILSDQERIGG